MKINEDISRNLIKKISIEFNDALGVGLEESSNSFPYTIAFIKFLEILNEFGIDKDINILDFDIRDKICTEFSNYLNR